MRWDKVLFALSLMIAFAVSSAIVQGADLAGWNFEDQNYLIDTTSANNTTNIVTSSGTPTSPAFAAGESSTYAASWSNLAVQDVSYVEVPVNTTGYNTIVFVYSGRTSSTASKYWKLQYSTTGSSGPYTDFGSSVEQLNTAWTVANTFDLSAISGVNDNANVVFRVVATGTPSWVQADGAGVPASGGTFRIDNILITGNAISTATLDFGDAPDQTIGPTYFYPTTLVTHGDPARHLVMPGVFMGLTVDMEADGFPSINADGDDNNASDDEDGVSWSSLVLGSTGTLTVSPSVNGYVSAWIDFNADGDWQDSGEQIYSDVSVTAPGPFTIVPSFTIPPTATLGTTYLRVRYYLFPGVPCNQDHGLCMEGGEVEDYTVMIEDVMTEYDFGDAPDQTIPPGTYFYPTTLVTHGNPARHVITMPPMFMGLSPLTDIDSEPDGQPDPIAAGDDNDTLFPPPNDDENGSMFMLPLQAGSMGTLQVQLAPMNPFPGYISAWLDINADGDWADSGEQICIDNGPHPPGVMAIITFPIPYTSTVGPTFARVRLTSTPGNINCNATTGLCPDGEVEDHWVEIMPPAPITLVINEIDYDQPGTDDREFVEIYNYGPTAIDLSNVDLVLVNGGLTTPAVYRTHQLSSAMLAPNDYWVVCAGTLVANCDQNTAFGTNWIQNGDTSPPIDNGDAAALVVHGTTTIIDTVGYCFPVTGWTEGAGNAPSDPPVVAPPDYSINRCPDGIDTNDNAADFFVREISPGIANPCTVTDPTGCAATFTTICEGDSTDLSASSVFEIHWFNDICGGTEVGIGSPLTVSPITTTTYHAQAYDVLSGTWSAGCCSITVNVNALPVMTCPGDFDVTIDTAAFTLTGATPAGGTYSGDGVTADVFDPAVAGLGPHLITYTYTDANTCTNTCTFTITVTEPATATPEPTATPTTEPPTATPTGPTPTPTDTPTASPIPATGPAGIGLLLLALGSLMSFAGIRRKK